MKRRIYILSDQRPGHINQSKGLLLSLNTTDTIVETVNLPTPRHALKHLCLTLANLFNWSPALLRRIYSLYYGAPLPQLSHSDLFVSTGGDTLAANIILGQLHQTPKVFIGKRSRHTDKGIGLLITTSGKSVPDKVVVTDFAPVNIRPTPKQPCEHSSLLIAVLIGGNSTEYHYSENDFEQLAINLIALCQRTSATLLITTSRRTGANGDHILKKNIPPHLIKEATWYSENPAPTAGDYCNKADIIFCSEDSGTMLTESISYGKPVVSFYPAQKNIPEFYKGFLDKMQKYNVTPCEIPKISTLAIAALPNALTPNSSVITLALTKLLEKTASVNESLNKS